MTVLYVQPFNSDAQGFYFSDIDQYCEALEQARDCFGRPVEEFQIIFVDGDDLELFTICGVNQGNLALWFEIEDLDERQKAALFFLCAQLGYSAEDALPKVDEVMLTKSSLRDAAIDLFDEIYLPGIPEPARYYIDYHLFAQDCLNSGDLQDFKFADRPWTCLNPSQL